MVIYLERGAGLHMAQQIPLPLTVSCFSKIQIGFLPFWYQLTRVVPDKELLNGCVCVIFFGWGLQSECPSGGHQPVKQLHHLS